MKGEAMKLAGIFRNKSDSTKQDYSQKAVQSAIEKACLEMKKQGVDRLVMHVQSIKDGEAKTGEKQKNVSTFYSKYYSAKSLQAIERQHLDGKTGVDYQAVSLVAPGVRVFEDNAYPGDAGYFIEIVNRKSVYVFSLVNPDRIGNDWGVYPESQFGVFCRLNQESRGIMAPQVLETVEKGIAEYRQITMRLLTSGGVFEAVGALEARKFATIADEALNGIREAIASAKKG